MHLAKKPRFWCPVRAGISSHPVWGCFAPGGGLEGPIWLSAPPCPSKSPCTHKHQGEEEQAEEVTRHQVLGSWE